MPNYKTLFQAAIEQALNGATVVTGNKRAARHLMAACEARLRQTRTAWLTPDILPLDAWLQRLWQDCLFHGASDLVLLNGYQAAALWESIIADAAEQLENQTGTAVAVAEAWNLVHEYGIPLSAEAFAAQPETQAFYRWAQQYDQFCSAQGWIDGPRLSDTVCRMLPDLSASIRDCLVLYGFDEITPRQRRLIAALETTGKQVLTLLPDSSTVDDPRPSKIAATDAQAELYAAARWSAAKLWANADAQIGVVITRLSDMRADAEFIFTEVLHPESLVTSALGLQPAFDLSLGPALASHPIVNAALLALEITLGQVATHDAGVLLRSPNLGGGIVEAGPRANFDLYLRGHAGLQVTAAQVCGAYDREDSHCRCPQLRKILGLATELAEPLKTARSRPSQWAGTIAKLLAALGWPGSGEGGRSLDSAEYQTAQSWSELVSEFASLDCVMPSLTAADALSQLRRMATDKLFKPENIGAPVQIMGMLEATGSTFDHLWICGASDEVWPPHGNINAFVPIALQRAANVPHSVPAQEFEFAEKVTARLIQSAGEVVFSWPKRQEDRALRPSPLLTKMEPRTEDEMCGPPPAGWTEWQAGVTLEDFVDEQAPPLGARGVLRGGTRVFELQSNCPFHAFVEMRLGAARLEEPESGIRAQDRGKVVEKALELIWGQLRDHFTLQNTGRDDLDNIIVVAVSEAMEQLGATADQWECRYRGLERKRLINLLNEWLELEKSREPFKAVAHQQPVVVSAGGICVNGRIDRIDQTHDGGLVILDYKTGGSSYGPGQWRGPRPERPQLQLYTTCQTVPVSAVAFALLSTGGGEFKGYGVRPQILAKQKDMTAKYFAPGDTFEQHIGKWRAVLDGLGQGYASGSAEVDPQPEHVCDYCHLLAVCRLAEQGQTRVNANDEDGKREPADVE